MTEGRGRKDKDMKLADKIMKTLSILALVPTVWMFASWLDIIAHNTTTYVYAWWNFFTLF